jgi:hypothetical protein
VSGRIDTHQNLAKGDLPQPTHLPDLRFQPYYNLDSDIIDSLQILLILKVLGNLYLLKALLLLLVVLFIFDIFTHLLVFVGQSGCCNQQADKMVFIRQNEAAIGWQIFMAFVHCWRKTAYRRIQKSEGSGYGNSRSCVISSGKTLSKALV